MRNAVFKIHPSLMRQRITFLLLSISLLAGMQVGCQCPMLTCRDNDYLAKNDAERISRAISNAVPLLCRAGKELDDVDRHLAEWGHASISGFVLVPDHSGYFALNYGISMSNYVDDAKSSVNGQAAFLSEKQTTAQFTATGANSMPGLNVQAQPPPELVAQQQTNLLNQLRDQGQLAAINQQIALKLGQLELLQLTNSNASLTNQAALPANAVQIANPPGAPLLPTGPTNTTPVVSSLITSVPPSVITNGFSPLGQLASQLSNNQLSPTTVLKLAATAKETERVLSFMSHPVDLPGNKRVFFAIGQISVMPGWRTKRDYICEVSTHLVYAGREGEITNRLWKLQGDEPYGRLWRNVTDKIGLREKESSSRSGQSRDYSDNEQLRERLYASLKNVYSDDDIGTLCEPSMISLVAAFPFMESQVFDLQSSYRNQMNLLLNLAGSFVQAGYKLDASVLINFVKQTQKDLSTRTAFPTVIPGVEADMLTYRFDPEVTAMTDPAQTEPHAGSLLLPTSIPVMILAECDKKDLAIWPELSVQVETRWIPRNGRGSVANFEYGDSDAGPSQALIMANKLDEAKKYMDAINDIQSDNYTSLSSYSELRRRYTSLQILGIGRNTWLQLPKQVPAVYTVSPANIPADYRGRIILAGENLSGDCGGIQVLLGGVPLWVRSARSDMVEARIDPERPPVAGADDLVFTNGYGAVVLTQAVVVADATPVINSLAPAIIPRDFPGLITISGEHLGDRIAFFLGGTPLPIYRIGKNAVEVSVPQNALKTAVYNLTVQNRFGAFVSSQTITVTNYTPSVQSVAPTNVAANFPGTITITGEHFGSDLGNIHVRLGGADLQVLSVNDNTIDAAKNFTDLKAGTNNLSVETDEGSVIVTQSIVVTADASLTCPGRPVLQLGTITPNHGYFDRPTTFVVTGEHFNPASFYDPVTVVLVGGVAATNIHVVSDNALRFDVPMWNTNANKSPYQGGLFGSKADVVILSGCQGATISSALSFDLSAPLSPAATPSTIFPTNAVTQLIDTQATALKALVVAQTNIVPQLTGSLRVEAGIPSTQSTNSPPPGTSSTVVIQNGQNTSTNH
jgi:hypothetical protein